MPTPKMDESKSDFLDRCPGIVMGDGTTDDSDQAVAICEGLWEDRERTSPVENLKRMWADMWARIETIITPKRATQPDPKERALAMSRVFERARMAIDAAYPQEWIYIHDIFQDGDTWFATGSSNGNLYQYPLAVTESDVTVGERVQVVENFTPVQQTITVTRQADGRYRWLSVSATALINKAGEIDSTALFDDFERQSLEPDFEWPYRCFFHLGEQFRTGQVDFIARWEYGLITSGLYDETDIAQAEVQARLKDPDGWRDSIHFVPTAKTRTIDVNGVTIPVYDAGKFVEVTTAPAGDVCSYGTTQTMIQEVNRMQKGTRQFEAFVALMDGDEEKADQWLAENPGAATRAVAEGAIARTDDETQPEDPPAQEPPAVEREVAVDDELVGIIANQVLAHLGGDDGQLAQITTALEGLARRVEDLGASAERTAQALDERITPLEMDDEERVEIIRQDMPRREKITVGYRPRVDHSKKSNGGRVNLASIADETLSNMPTRRVRK